jgi:prophage regulatory protein
VGVNYVRVLDPAALRAKGIPYSNVHLLRMEREGRFPRRLRLGENRVAYLEAEVDAWLKARLDARDDPVAASSARPRGWKTQPDPKPTRRRKVEQTVPPAAEA